MTLPVNALLGSSFELGSGLLRCVAELVVLELSSIQHKSRLILASIKNSPVSDAVLMDILEL